MLDEDLLYWDFAQEVKNDQGIQRIYTKSIANGKPIGPTETFVRCSCHINDVEPEHLYDMVHKTESRLKWDDRMEHMEDIEVEGLAPNEIIKYFILASSNLPLVN